MTTTFVDLDVRPLLSAGEEPFGKIMETVSALGEGEGLRLLATFKPIPLFSVLGSKGFSYEAREIGGGDWEVLFTPAGTAQPEETPAPLPASKDEEWPQPARHMDNRELDPPEPMVRILAAVEEMNPGEVLSALLCREPIFLLPELAKRGHRWQGAFEPDGTTYRLLVRIEAKEA
ncbi:DUF2249 domain-containing protein [Pseudaminobacter arsenicus]|uniref:DUF2249 domain-containing protein n=1 Tax=Borborobacter arsenicus TaxID=1851146 RepID=A0A432V6E0_9HYPH|nr:DUF2249 domain-containing protein [Pseudaminobacter arsenicus]RUM97643.1 DUF2249 domain-containing protein [Pseudaminobacter arsenicus]